MWDAFLERTCHSCSGLTSPPFCKRKTDLSSYEYSRYLPRDVISCFEYPMNPTKKNPRKGTPKSPQGYFEKYKNEQKAKETKPVTAYFKVNAQALRDDRPAYPPHCSTGKSCTCKKKFGKNVAKPETDVAVLRVETPKLESVQPFRPSRADSLLEATKVQKVCKEPTVENYGRKIFNFSYREKGKKKDAKGKKDVPPVKQQPPPFTPAAHAKAKSREKKKGALLEERTKSMPLYKAVLSRLDLARWKLFLVSR